ncbi:hypothetical protein SASPL_145355 [Salvia splendens]|uniref:FAE domain-containing protein n=1 Tax=Salvia splendens TaxID=180675 RepID=A0A8X8WHD6_SALSN|nr:hypothetical protein SASPL_145355 [Salvia splendens]
MKKNGARDQATSLRNVVSGSSGSGRRSSVPALAPLPANPSTTAPLPPLPIVDPRLSEQLERLLHSLPIGTDAATTFAHLRANLVFSRYQNLIPTSAAQISAYSPKSQIQPSSPRFHNPISNPPVHNTPTPTDIEDNYSGATVLAEDLEAIEKGEDVEQPIAHPAEDTAKPTSRLEEKNVELSFVEIGRPTSRLEGAEVELPVEGNHKHTNNIFFSEYGVAIAITIASLLLVYFSFSSKTRPIYLLDSCCYLPPPNLRATKANYIEHFELCAAHEREAIDFQTKMVQRSGIGCEACLPVSVHRIPPDKSLSCTQEETETVIFTVVKDLNKQSINPKSIDILVTNCSIFCPTPSITVMIINKFGFRNNIKSVSLSGMGCSASLVTIGLAKDLLRIQGNLLALVLSMEAVTLVAMMEASAS